jgi:hypothetical protein
MEDTLMIRSAAITALVALATSASAQSELGPAEDGDPAVVAFKVINGNFDDTDCPSVTQAKRLKDGSVYAICSNGERFRVYGKISMKCSAAEKLGVAGCDNTPVPSVGPLQQTPMPPIGNGFPDGKPLDIVGVYPGMKYDKALPIVSDYLHTAPKIFTSLNPTTGGLYVNAVTGPWIEGGGERADNLTVWLTPDAAGNQVIGVARKLNFKGPGETSSLELFNALKAKYGMPDRIYNRYGESYNQSNAPPSTDYSLRWVFNIDQKQKRACLSHVKLSPYGSRGVLFASGALAADFYSQIAGCGVVLDINITIGSFNEGVSSMDALMVDFERTNKAMVVAETRDERKRRVEKLQKLPPPNL